VAVRIKVGKYKIYIRKSEANPKAEFKIIGTTNSIGIIKKQEAEMINLVKQYNLTSIQKHLINCVKRGEKRDRIMARLKAIIKKEAIFIGSDKVKEVRVVIGRQLAYTRCCPTDTFDLSRGVAMCICDILNKQTVKKEVMEYSKPMMNRIIKTIELTHVQQIREQQRMKYDQPGAINKLSSLFKSLNKIDPIMEG